jgi:hypothetical protein
VRHAVAHGLRAQGLAYVGRRAVGEGVPWLQVVAEGDIPDPAAEALIFTGRRPAATATDAPIGAGQRSAVGAGHAPPGAAGAHDAASDVTGTGRTPSAAVGAGLAPPGDAEDGSQAPTAVGAGLAPPAFQRLRPGQLLGLAASADELEDAIPLALDAGLDVLLLEASAPVEGAWPEIAGAPDLTVIRDAVRILRRLNREEDITLLYFGGVRSGTDAAKLIGLGANAVVVGLSLALAVGGGIESGSVAFYGDVDQAERDEKAELFLKALRAEASIMPRCTGKTDIANLEPEDLRAISVATATAAGIPLAGHNPKLAAPLGA